MADILLKNSEGKIWANNAGKILLGKKFSEDVIQDGLTFWGRTNPLFLTLINGYVSEAYDVRGNGTKMIQIQSLTDPSL
jgi:hypothetical protein